MNKLDSITVLLCVAGVIGWIAAYALGDAGIEEVVVYGGASALGGAYILIRG